MKIISSSMIAVLNVIMVNEYCHFESLNPLEVPKPPLEIFY